MKPTALIILLLALPSSASVSINERAARWCGEEQHPRYSEHERIICLAAFHAGAYEGELLGRNIPNTEPEIIIRGTGTVCTVTVGEEVIECPEKAQ